MTYVDGFVAAVPVASKDEYHRHAAWAAPIFRELGATRLIENWGDDVPDGKVTDFKGAVKATPEEVVVFSWIEYPDKATRDRAGERMMSDPRFKQMNDMPFDAKRMIYGGFSIIVDQGKSAGTGYVDGMLIAAPSAGKEAYRAFAEAHAALFRDHGALRVVDAWGDDVPDGKVTDFRRAVKATPEEAVAYGWVEWPSKAARDAAWQKLMADPRMHEGGPMPFDGKRMVYGGFATILDA